MWRNEIEQLDEELPCIHEILQPVRKLLYKLLCISHVTEYGQRHIDSFVQLRIDITPCKPETLSALTELPFDIKTKLMFNALLTCTDQKFNIEIMDDDGIKGSIFLLGNVKLPFAAADEPPQDIEKIKEYIGAALTCTCILFATKNELISENYIDALIMACFCCAMDETPPKLAARPGPTGVTIGAQFMLLLKHARMLASLLGLEELLPLPSSIFQPFIYIPLHGIAFKIWKKERFHNEDKKALDYYKDILLNKSFVKYRNLITTTDCFDSIVNQYLSTKVTLLDHKIAATSQKTINKAKKKK